MRSYKIPRRNVISSHILSNINCTEPQQITNIREELNNSRDLLNNIYKDDKYKQISYALDYCRYVRLIITSKYNAQNVSNSWLKMYEIMSYYKLLDDRSRYYFANCEMPGSFIMAFNHYNSTMLNSKVEWYASSILSSDQTNNYFGDRYMLLSNYPSRWLMSNTNNGDTTSMSNIVDISIKLLQRTNNRLVDLYTSDGGLDVSSDYNNQEVLGFKLLIGQVVMGLHTLASNGNLVIKMFTYFEPLSLSLLYILSSIFNELNICKPMSSRSTNSEVYVVCKGYNGCPLWMRSLLCNRLCSNDISTLISTNYIYKDVVFMDAINRSYDIFRYQIISLKHNVLMYNKYRNKIYNLVRLSSYDKESAVSRYLSNTNILCLSNCNKILCKEDVIRY